MVMACPAILVCSKLKPGMAKKKGGGAVGPLPRFFGGFDIVYRGKPEVMRGRGRSVAAKTRRSEIDFMSR